MEMVSRGTVMPYYQLVFHVEHPAPNDTATTLQSEAPRRHHLGQPLGPPALFHVKQRSRLLRNDQLANKQVALKGMRHMYGLAPVPALHSPNVV